MNIANRPSLAEITQMPIAEVIELPPEVLALLQEEADAEMRSVKAAKTRLDGALTIRYATRAAAERQAAGKDTDTIRFDDGAVTVIADLPKRVDWDQDRLAAWPDAIRASFEPARTVRPGTLKIEIVPQGGDQ